MKIERVSYSYLSNLGDYSNERIEMEARLEEGEIPEDAIAALKDRVHALAGEHIQRLEQRRYQIRQEIEQLHKRLEQARVDWEAVAEFLRAQGIKPNAPAAPLFNNLLQAASDDVEVLDQIPF